MTYFGAGKEAMTKPQYTCGRLAGIVFGLVLGAVAVSADEWGNLKGQFLYGGDPPQPDKLTITKDEQECCQHNLVDESLVVQREDHGLRSVVVFLYPARDQQVAVHPSYDADEKAEWKLDNQACRFDPHVLLLWKRHTLLIGNSDPIGHNAMVDTRKNRPINVTIPSGETIRHKFTLEEREPIAVSCSIHPWMRAWLLVRDNPYMAVTDEHGRFEIKNLPVGKWEFAFWQERASFLTDVVLNGQPVRWKRGRTEIEIKPGDNDLGVVTIEPAALK